MSAIRYPFVNLYNHYKLIKSCIKILKYIDEMTQQGYVKAKVTGVNC